MVGKCPECGGSTYQIRVLDTGHLNAHHTLHYAAIDAKANWLNGAYPVKGTLAAELCESCGRVTFRAVPRSLGQA